MNPLFPAGTFMAEGMVHSTTDIIPEDELKQTRFYKEWIKPQGIGDALAINLENGMTRSSLINVRMDASLGFANEEARRRLGSDLHDGLGPALAGVAFGLLAIKPQFGIPLVVVVLVGREWPMLAGALASVVAQVGAASWVLGSEAFRRFIAATLSISNRVALSIESPASHHSQSYRPESS